MTHIKETETVGHSCKAVNLAHKAALYIDDTELPDFESMLHEAKESAAKSLNVPHRMISGEIPEPVFLPSTVELCPVINMEHDYRVYRQNGVLIKIECSYCSHKIDIGNSEFIEIPGSPWYIQKSKTGRVERIPEAEENDDAPIIKRSDLIICSVLLVVAVITIAAHWIFGG